jgi:hypothetical protein
MSAIVIVLVHKKVIWLVHKKVIWLVHKKVIWLVHKKVICKTAATGIECPGAMLPFPAPQDR